MNLLLVKLVVSGLLAITLNGDADGQWELQATGQSPSICNKGAKVTLYQSGALQECGAIANYFPANGVRCNKLGPAGFFESGKLKSCVLADPATIGGQKCNQYGPISFFEDGKLESCINSTK